MFTNANSTMYTPLLTAFDTVAADESLCQRIAAQIHEACRLLMRLDELEVCEIKVAVNNRHAVLSGSVECSRLRRLAESIARSIPEVKSVTSQIRIGEEPPVAARDSARSHTRMVDLTAAR
jgi:hypothetical protein